MTHSVQVPSRDGHSCTVAFASDSGFSALIESPTRDLRAKPIVAGRLLGVSVEGVPRGALPYIVHLKWVSSLMSMSHEITLYRAVSVAHV